MRVVLAIAALAAVGAGSWAWYQQEQQRELISAGSPDHFAPPGQIQLVAKMESAGADERADEDLQGSFKRVSDSRIQMEAMRKLQQMNLPLDRVDVRIEDATVVLEGRVDDRTTRDAFEITVRAVEGVREVENRIELASDE